MKKTSRAFSLVLAVAFAVAFMPFDSLAKGGGGGSSGGGRSFSSPSHSAPRSYSTPAAPRSFSTPSAPAAPRSFTTPGAPKTGPQTTLPSAPKTKYDTGAGQAARKDISQQKYDAANPKSSPAPDYRDARIHDLQRDLSRERMQNRELRNRQTYGGYYGRPTPCCYNDGFNIWFWLWLMDRPRADRDVWVYNHRDEIDPGRLEELKKKDADLDRRLKELEAKGVQKDPSYVPQGIERDQMYSDDYVQKAFAEKNKSHFSWGWVIGIVVILVLGYLIFFARIFKRR